MGRAADEQEKKYNEPHNNAIPFSMIMIKRKVFYKSFFSYY